MVAGCWPGWPAPSPPRRQRPHIEDRAETGAARGHRPRLRRPARRDQAPVRRQVEARNDAGKTVGKAKSSDTGAWGDQPRARQLHRCPGQGTLPSGVEVQESEIKVTLTEGSDRPVLFSFGAKRASADISSAAKLTRLAIDGIRFGLIIAITGVGLSLIFGTTGLTNFAHGELVTLGAVIAWAINVKLGLQLIPATVLAIVAGVGIGILNELGIWRPLRRRGVGLVAMLVVSIGLGLILRYLILIFFSDRSKPFDDYQIRKQIGSGAFAITPVNLWCIIISLVTILAVAVMLQKTRIGKAMRAVADNRDLAASSGINVDRVILLVWALAGGLAALGGVLFAVSELGGRVQWEMGFKLLLPHVRRHHPGRAWQCVRRPAGLRHRRPRRPDLHLLDQPRPQSTSADC